MRLALLVLAAGVCLSEGRWLRRARSDQPKESSFVGEATNELSTAILQGYIDDVKNLAFSPLGYSAILAILAEGARGETKQQLATALHLPEDDVLTRKTYHYIMERLKNTNEYKFNQPELKNWFYIYKNYTINDDYKKILEDHYLTEVRTVERYVPYNPVDDTDDEDKPENFEDKKPVPDYQPEPTKDGDETVDLLPPKESDEKLISFAVEDKPEKLEPPADFEYKPAKNIKEKIKLAKTYPKKSEYSSEEEETMVAVEARNHGRSLKVLNQRNDITSSISVNSVGKKMSAGDFESAEEILEFFAFNSLMIMFNGMYFRGAWKKPFDVEEPGAFYISPTEKKQVPMMKTRGKFRTGSLPGLDSVAIELPYDGGRYSLIVVVPRARDGLTRLIADLPAAPLSDLRSTLREQTLDVSLPSFYVETTTKPVAALAKFGVSAIFSPEADLSGISPSEGLFVQEMVQHVAVRVDNAKSSASELTADSVVESFKNVPVPETTAKKFSVEHPFVFFINDMLDNLVVVAGKVSDPKQPLSLDDKL